MLPKFKRLSARAASNKNLAQAQAQRLQGSADQIVELVALSMSIADALNAGDLETAMMHYREESVPRFGAVWAADFTLMREAETQFPRR